jgi:hypothetical protein
MKALAWLLQIVACGDCPEMTEQCPFHYRGTPDCDSLHEFVACFGFASGGFTGQYEHVYAPRTSLGVMSGREYP